MLAAYAAYAAYAAVADAAAKTKIQLETADICRKYIGQMIIEKVKCFSVVSDFTKGNLS